MIPGKPYEVQVEIWPTSFVFPKGYRLIFTGYGQGLPVSRHAGTDSAQSSADRDKDDFKGINTILTGGSHPAWIQMPLIAAD